MHDAIKTLLPELFTDESLVDLEPCGSESEVVQGSDGSSDQKTEEARIGLLSDGAEIKVVRIQGIEPQLEIPFGWVVKNLMNPDQYLHICMYIKVAQPFTIC